MSRRRRYRFMHQAGGRYYWECVNRGRDSRTEFMSCGVEWFWNPTR